MRCDSAVHQGAAAADGSPAARRGKHPYKAPRPSSVTGGHDADAATVADDGEADAAAPVNIRNKVLFCLSVQMDLSTELILLSNLLSTELIVWSLVFNLLDEWQCSIQSGFAAEIIQLMLTIIWLMVNSGIKLPDELTSIAPILDVE